ncbi:hypothetical protein H9L12_10815 [Sphingomonas rhizophila]|uniref:DUF418 domain-containing protein n=1 Tax=Sphingomonas rhizophila TaxID=2071607 RepID=A0A7G9SA65_9SPHN|nr:hypothetical protein [Sphingomonas rhizophila]QNN64740.1 hypothetical protein H9L12_10815 [Sphingomonas rhizophila]
MAQAIRSAPVVAGERSTLLDAMRGYALAGILIANMFAFIGFPFMTDAQRDASLGGRSTIWPNSSSNG